MKQQYKSESFMAIHESAVADFEVGAINDDKMRMYDDMCLVKVIPEVPHVSFSSKDVPTRRPSPIAERSVRK